MPLPLSGRLGAARRAGSGGRGQAGAGLDGEAFPRSWLGNAPWGRARPRPPSPEALCAGEAGSGGRVLGRSPVSGRGASSRLPGPQGTGHQPLGKASPGRAGLAPGRFTQISSVAIRGRPRRPGGLSRLTVCQARRGHGHRAVATQGGHLDAGHAHTPPPDGPRVTGAGSWGLMAALQAPPRVPEVLQPLLRFCSGHRSLNTAHPLRAQPVLRLRARSPETTRLGVWPSVQRGLTMPNVWSPQRLLPVASRPSPGMVTSSLWKPSCPLLSGCSPAQCHGR